MPEPVNELILEKGSNQRAKRGSIDLYFWRMVVKLEPQDKPESENRYMRAFETAGKLVTHPRGLTLICGNSIEKFKAPNRERHSCHKHVTQIEEFVCLKTESMSKALDHIFRPTHTYPCPDGAMKYKQQWTLLSGIDLRFTLDSAFRKSSHLLSM